VVPSDVNDDGSDHIFRSRAPDIHLLYRQKKGMPFMPLVIDAVEIGARQIRRSRTCLKILHESSIITQRFTTDLPMTEPPDNTTVESDKFSSSI